MKFVSGKYLGDMIVLLYLSIFVIALTTLLATMAFDYYWSSLMVFLFGICVGYISNKGQESGFIRRGLIVAAEIAVFAIAYSFYISSTILSSLMSLFNGFTTTQNDLSFLIGSNYPSPVLISLLSAIFLIIGSLFYSFVLEKTCKKSRNKNKKS